MTERNYTHYRGDTWAGMVVTVLVNGSPLDLAGAGVVFKMKKRGAMRSDAAAVTKSVGSGILLTNPSGGVFTISPTVIDVASGVYNYDVEITTAAGKVATYIKGTFTVEDDIG